MDKNKKQQQDSSWLPTTNKSFFKNTWEENLKKSVKETHGHEGQSCDEAHPDMSHEEWEATHDDHEGCATCGESVITEEQLTEAMKSGNPYNAPTFRPDLRVRPGLYFDHGEPARKDLLDFITYVIRVLALQRMAP